MKTQKEKIYCKFCRRLVSNKRGHPSLKYRLCSDCYELLRKHNVNEISKKFEKVIQSKQKEFDIEKEKWLEERGRMAKLLFEVGVTSW